MIDATQKIGASNSIFVEESKEFETPDSLMQKGFISEGSLNKDSLSTKHKDSTNCFAKVRLSNALEKISEAPYLLEIESEINAGMNSRVFRDNSSNLDYGRIWSNTCKEQKLIDAEASSQVNRRLVNTGRDFSKSQNLINKQMLINDCIEVTPEPEEHVYSPGEENISDIDNFENIDDKYSAQNYDFSPHP